MCLPPSEWWGSQFGSFQKRTASLVKTSQADNGLPNTGTLGSVNSLLNVADARLHVLSPSFVNLLRSSNCALPALFSSPPTPGYAEGMNVTYHVGLSFAMVSLLEVGAIGGGCVLQVRGHRALGLCRGHTVQDWGCEGRLVGQCCSAADSETEYHFQEAHQSESGATWGGCLLVLVSP